MYLRTSTLIGSAARLKIWWLSVQVRPCVLMLNPNEKRVLLEFIDQLSDYQSNAGCNDFELENTDENWDLVVKAEDWNGIVGEEAQERPDKGEKIYTMDCVILGYLKSLLEKE